MRTICTHYLFYRALFCLLLNNIFCLAVGELRTLPVSPAPVRSHFIPSHKLFGKFTEVSKVHLVDKYADENDDKKSKEILGLQKGWSRRIL